MKDYISGLPLRNTIIYNSSTRQQHRPGITTCRARKRRIAKDTAVHYTQGPRNKPKAEERGWIRRDLCTQDPQEQERKRETARPPRPVCGASGGLSPTGQGTFLNAKRRQLPELPTAEIQGLPFVLLPRSRLVHFLGCSACGPTSSAPKSVEHS